MANGMIEMIDVCKTYMMGDTEVKALDHIQVSIKEHEFVAILGPSGSGKSTFMNIVGCLDIADEGQYFLDGEDVSRLSPRKLASLRSRKIGFVFQQFNLLQKLSALENVELPLIYQGMTPSRRREQAEEALERVGLSDRMKHRPNELSGGQQQRVAIARALASRPSLILADEPTGNLDSRSGRDIMAMMHELNEQGNTIVLITHDSKVADQAQRMLHIYDGRVTDVPPGEATHDPYGSHAASAAQLPPSGEEALA